MTAKERAAKFREMAAALEEWALDEWQFGLGLGVSTDEMPGRVTGYLVVAEQAHVLAVRNAALAYDEEKGGVPA